MLLLTRCVFMRSAALLPTVAGPIFWRLCGCLIVVSGASITNADEWSSREFPYAGVRLSFPEAAQPGKEDFSGNEAIEAFSLSVEDGTRLTLDGMQSDLAEALQGQIIETSPIVWHGCPGSEWTLLYTKRFVDVMYLYRRKDVRVGDKLLVLEHKVLLPDDVRGLTALRHYQRAASERFFRSLEPLNTLSAEVQTSRGRAGNILGRWVSVPQPGQKPAHPLEFNFLKVKSDQQFWIGAADKWGDSSEGVTLAGEFHEHTGDQFQGMLEVTAGDDRYWVPFEIDGPTLYLSLSKTQDQVLDRKNCWIFRRPGNTPDRPETDPLEKAGAKQP
jgi:hypothetical protein